MRRVLIRPTHFKDYRNPHIAQIWYKAERLLRDADRIIIIGYSLPEDDVDVIIQISGRVKGMFIVSVGLFDSSSSNGGGVTIKEDGIA